MTPRFARAARVLVLACALALVAASGASAAGTGSITGTVTDHGAAPTGGVCVGAHTSEGFPHVADVAPDGSYTVSDLEPGSYEVYASGCQGWDPIKGELTPAGDYLRQYFDGATSEQHATPVPVNDGDTAGPIDFALVKPAHITGTVTDSATHAAPTDGVCVDAWLANGEASGHATVASDGSYDIGGLPAGSYTVRFSGCQGFDPNTFEPTPAGDYIAQTRSNPVAATAGDTTANIDAALDKASHIKGSVTDAAADDGHLTGGVCVNAWQPDTHTASTAIVASDGTYDIGGLPAGDYTVQFSGCPFNPATHQQGPAATYVPQYYDGATNPQKAHLVTVTRGSDTTGIDAALSQGGHITGTVSDATHQHVGAGAVCVSANDENAGAGGSDITDASGAYDIGGLPAGSYRVSFGPCDSETFDWQYYDAAKDWTKANLVTIAAGATHSGIDATMTKDTTPTDGGGDTTGSGDTTGGADAPGGDTTTDTTPAPAPVSKPAAPVAQPAAKPAAKPAAQCLVPNLKGKSLANAKKLLAKANCKVGKVAKAASKKVKKGLVASQAKKAGKALPAGTRINLVLSRGRH